MAKADVQNISEGGTYTAAAGSNRLVVIAGNGESAYSSRPLVGISMGGVAFTEAVTAVDGTATKGGIWYIKEADIPSGAQTITVDWNGQVHDTFMGSIYTLTDIDQDNPLYDVASNFQADVTSLPLDFNGVDGGFLIAEGGTNNQSVPISSSGTNDNSTVALTFDRSVAAPNHYVATMSALLSATEAETIDIQVGLSTNATGAVAVFNSVPSLTISDVDGDEAVYPGQSYQIQATDDILATAGTVFWEKLDGTDPVQHTVTNWNNVSNLITVTAVQDNHRYGALYRVRVVLNDASEVIFDNSGNGLTLEAEPNTAYADVTDPAIDDSAALAYQTSHEVVTGDQVQVRDTYGLGGLTVDEQTFIEANTTGQLEARFFDAGDEVWGAWETVSFGDGQTPSGSIPGQILKSIKRAIARPIKSAIAS